MSGKFHWLLVVGVLCSFTIPSDDIYDQKGYYMFPIRPGEINYLSGSMGELRRTHFHSGIDIKTGGVQGYNVYATADGFLNRINVSLGGYGKALYIQHPNNTFSVYAHLGDFSQEVADYVKIQQYRKKSYVVNLFPKKGAFNFDKGDIIAASGNTGSSSAPHLHFEIRDGDHRILDPLRFDFPEIRDTRVPEVKTIAFKTIDIDSRVNGQFGRMDFNTSREENVFSLTEAVKISGRIGVEIYAYDRQDDTNNRYGLPCVEFYHNDSLLYSHHIKVFAFSDTRNLLVHTNYSHMTNTRRRVHKLYIDDGNKLNFYDGEGNGVISIKDTLSHNFNIKLWDVKGNFSETKFEVNSTNNAGGKSPIWKRKEHYRVTDNTLELYAEYDDVQPSHITVYANRFSYEIEPAFKSDDKAYYLWDLRDGLPDSIDYCGTSESLNFRSTIPPGTEFSYFSNELDLEFGKNTLFDTLYLQSWVEIDSSTNREIFKFDHKSVPIRRNIEISLTPSLECPDKERTSVYAVNGNGSLSYYGGKWENGQMNFHSRELIDFTLAIDSIAPSLQPIKTNKDELRFIIDDDLSGIASFDAFVNGEWVLMNYESKKKLIWSEKLNENIPFDGELILQVKDNAGNETVYKVLI